MPELPEVQTTVEGINKTLKGLSVSDAWTDWEKMIHYRPFKAFQKALIGEKFRKAERRGKNILIHFGNDKTVLIHMKMTGHIMYGHYNLQKNKWLPHSTEKNEALKDPYNRFIHVVFSLNNGKHLVFSDTRKFGKIDLLDSKTHLTSKHLAHLGPEPLLKNFTFQIFKEQIQKRPRGKIKTVLMDQSVIAGIGNIYSDEILWRASINPEERVADLMDDNLQKIFDSIAPTLRHGIDFGGDSTSDYRNIHGERGKFQEKHQAYRRTGKPCTKPNCKGLILRKIVSGRSAHFCSIHQRLKTSQ